MPVIIIDDQDGTPEAQYPVAKYHTEELPPQVKLLCERYVAEAEPQQSYTSWLEEQLRSIVGQTQHPTEPA
jgi:hypothetical protein